MTVPVTLSFTEDQHNRLRRFLFPGDGKEAVAVALCGHRAGVRRHRLLVREIQEIPYEACSERSGDRVTWPPEQAEPLLDKAENERLSLIKIHSHPSGYADFSDTDTEGDKRLLPMIRGWVGGDAVHGSAVMLPSGEVFGRILHRSGHFLPIDTINMVGDDLLFWYKNSETAEIPGFAASHAQAFDIGTIERLRRLSVAVVGCSGTGSPVIEQLVRLGVGELVLVDDDTMEERNINRILNSRTEDARNRRPKVAVLAEAVARSGLETKIIPLQKNLWEPEVVKTVAECDVVFGCMDTVDGRFLLNALATYYTIPYFDIGVRLEAITHGPRRATFARSAEQSTICSQDAPA